MQRSINRHILQLFVGGALLATALLIGMILHLVGRQNAIAGAEREERARAVLEHVAAQARYDVLSNALWDLAYDRIGVADDVAWFHENLGAEQYEVMTQTGAAVVDDYAAPIMAAWEGEEVASLPLDGHGLGLGAALAAARPEQAGAFVLADGRPAYLAVHRTCMHTDESRCAPRTLVFVSHLDGLVKAVAESSAWDDLAVVAAAPERPSLPIHGAGGEVVGHLTWEVPRPGYEALRSAAPLLAAALGVIAVSVFGLSHRVRRTAERLMAAKREAERLSETDALTGVANRRAVVREIERGLRGGAGVQVLVIDFDGFKEINDTLGHDAGDLLLAEMARRMRALEPAGGLLARTGGDEFVMVAPVDEAEAAELGRDLMMTISGPVELRGQTISVSASVGHAAGAAGLAADEVMRRADMAMYDAKAQGLGGVRGYRPELDETLRLHRALDREMRSSLEEGRFKVVYQPILHAATGRFGGVEALLRWDHPVRGPISPADFIPAAERSRFIVELGDFVLREACLRLRDRPDLALSVNLSPVQLLDDRLTERVARILAETGFEPARLELEITEGYLITQEERALHALTRLREELGVRISLDDFGSGYASLGYLRRYPLDKIKIDGTLVRPIEDCPKARDLLLAVVALCRAFGIPVTAEGVETRAQADVLRAAGCDHLQGYLFGAPTAALPLAEGERGAA